MEASTILQAEQEAIEGQKLWGFLKKKYSISINDGVMLLHKDRRELNSKVIENLQLYIYKKSIDRIFLFTDADIIKINISNLYTENVGIKGLKAIERYYRLVQFTRNVVVVSEEAPFGSKGIIGKERIKIEDYVKDALFV